MEATTDFAIPFLVAVMGVITWLALKPTPNDPSEAPYALYRWLVILATIALIGLCLLPGARK
jgi:hypothetical protein